MSGEQLAVLALVVAAFLAGWLARGRAPPKQSDDLDPLLREADALLDRAVRACRAAVATGAQPRGPATRMALDIFDRSLADLDRLDRRLGTRLGARTTLYEAFRRTIDALGSVRHRLPGSRGSSAPGASLEAVTSARDAWGRARRGP